MTIEVTEEMLIAFREAVRSGGDNVDDIRADGLAAVLAIVERDHAMRPRRVQIDRDPHAHVCVTCSPDGRRPGAGCMNCRHTGMDQTPCLGPGHLPHCPAGCCEGGAS